MMMECMKFTLMQATEGRDSDPERCVSGRETQTQRPKTKTQRQTTPANRADNRADRRWANHTSAG